MGCGLLVSVPSPGPCSVCRVCLSPPPTHLRRPRRANTPAQRPPSCPPGLSAGHRLPDGQWGVRSWGPPAQEQGALEAPPRLQGAAQDSPQLLKVRRQQERLLRRVLGRACCRGPRQLARPSQPTGHPGRLRGWGPATGLGLAAAPSGRGRGGAAAEPEVVRAGVLRLGVRGQSCPSSLALGLAPLPPRQTSSSGAW